MNVTLTIPDGTANQLQYLAQRKQRSLETLLMEFLLETIRQKLADDQQLQKLVAETKALPYNPHNLRPAQGSLAEALQKSNPEAEVGFDLETWNKQWDMVEAEMKAIDKANDIAEGCYRAHRVVGGVRNMTANPVDANESSPKRDLFWLKTCSASDN